MLTLIICIDLRIFLLIHIVMDKYIHIILYGNVLCFVSFLWQCLYDYLQSSVCHNFVVVHFLFIFLWILLLLHNPRITHPHPLQKEIIAITITITITITTPISLALALVAHRSHYSCQQSLTQHQLINKQDRKYWIHSYMGKQEQRIVPVLLVL